MQFASNKICARVGFEPQAHNTVHPHQMLPRAYQSITDMTHS